MKTLSTLLLLLTSFYALAVVNPSGKTWDAGDKVLCNNGAIEANFTGTCATGWSAGALPTVTGPYLAFSDLISGPDTGLGDGAGSGVIVTVWGFNLGATQGSSTIEYVDSLSVARPCVVYYWKDADGALPSGPANLYESHGMQEIACSIPDSATGAGSIKVTVAGDETTLPFTVRTGNIYHVASTGNDTTGDGSYGNPWLTVDKADSTSTAGSTVYIRAMTIGSETTDRPIYNNVSLTDASVHFSYVAYPNNTVDVWGERGISGYNGGSTPYGMLASKLKIYASDADTDANDQPINSRNTVSFGIQGTTNGRAIANYITDTHPSDANGGCPDAAQAAITANKEFVENFKVLGNQIEEYGCAGTSYQHHTTYLSIRETSEPALVSPEMGWNYLANNDAKNGLHYFDEEQGGTGNRCGDFSDTFKVHDNVVINQGGAGIFNGVHCNFDSAFEYTNNVLINTGLKTSWDGVSGSGNLGATSAVALSPDSNQTSTLTFKNNTIIGWNEDDDAEGTRSCVGFASGADSISIEWSDNICTQTRDLWFIRSNYQGSQLEDNFTGGGNVWYTSAGTQVNAVAPSWDTTKITTDPLLTVNGSQVSVGSGSPIINQSTTTLLRDIYGAVRGAASNVGAVQ